MIIEGLVWKLNKAAEGLAYWKITLTLHTCFFSFFLGNVINNTSLCRPKSTKIGSNGPFFGK